MIRRVDPGRETVRHLLNTLDEACFPGDTLCPKMGWWWVAYTNLDPVAFAGLRPLAKEPHAGYFCRAGVLKHARGKGLQKKLIRVRIAYARRQGLKTLITDTTDNIVSANNLIACGFKLYEPSNSWAFDHSLYWRKDL